MTTTTKATNPTDSVDNATQPTATPHDDPTQPPKPADMPQAAYEQLCDAHAVFHVMVEDLLLGHRMNLVSMTLDGNPVVVLCEDWSASDDGAVGQTPVAIIADEATRERLVIQNNPDHTIAEDGPGSSRWGRVAEVPFGVLSASVTRRLIGGLVAGLAADDTDDTDDDTDDDAGDAS